METPKGLNAADAELIELARATIRANYDAQGEKHTVAAAVRCANGKVYAAVNLYHIHGSCAEVVVLGMAATAGERHFEAIVAVRGATGEEYIGPCGNCRQVLVDYAPDCDVILPGPDGPVKMKIGDLLPLAHRVYPEGYAVPYTVDRSAEPR